MNRHVVLIKKREGVDPSAVDAAKSGLEALQGQIPGIVAVSWGANNSPEGRNHGFDLGFTVDFVDAAARDAYLPHPAHQAYIPVALAVADDVLIFDFDI